MSAGVPVHRDQQRKRALTGYLLGDLDGHLDEAQLVELGLEIAHELLKGVDAVGLGGGEVKEGDELEGQLVP